MDLLIPQAQQDAYTAMQDPLNFPTEYLGWLDDRIKQLAIQQIQKVSVGDYKVSAQTADHTDAAGGFWLICDGTSISASWTDLIALVGSTRPDAQGRALVMKGTHTDVNAILKSDGLPILSRSPLHNTTKGTLAVTPNPHNHTSTAAGTNALVSAATPDASVPQFSTANTSNTTLTMAGAGGPGGTRPDDTPAFIVPGNLFIHT